MEKAQKANIVETSRRMNVFRVTPWLELRKINQVSADQIEFEVWYDNKLIGLGDLWTNGECGGSGEWVEDEGNSGPDGITAGVQDLAVAAAYRMGLTVIQ
jgi:hypothetical protein